MWLVVFKQYYYPSVFEYQTKEEAEEHYEQIKESNFPNEDWFDDGKLYVAEVINHFGRHAENVEWNLR